MASRKKKVLALSEKHLVKRRKIMNDDLDRHSSDGNGSDNEDGPTSARSLITFSSDNEKRLARQYEQQAEKVRHN